MERPLRPRDETMAERDNKHIKTSFEAIPGRRINPDGTLHTRKYARVPWHDYNEGEFFITISTMNKVHYFGAIQNGEMDYSDVGYYMCEVLRNINNHHQDASIPLWVVMPNHIHFILRLGDGISANHIKEPTHRKPTNKDGSRTRLDVVLGSIKSAVTRYANLNGLHFKWNDRFYEHIIIDSEKERNIYEYIKNNIARWEEDCFK